MGSVSSIPKVLNRTQAEKLAGTKWNEDAFAQLPKNENGQVTRDQLLHASGYTCLTRIPLNVERGTFVGTEATAELLRDVGGGEKIREMTSVFYQKAFENKWLDQFIHSHHDPHGDRLGNWIVEKMGGDRSVWTTTRPRDARQHAHFKAWHCEKRTDDKMGQHFKLEDCRTWMRIMFWTAREVGLDAHPIFFEWFVEFIGHFIGIYERTAPPYTAKAAMWSNKPKNIENYFANGKSMSDLL